MACPECLPATLPVASRIRRRLRESRACRPELLRLVHSERLLSVRGDDCLPSKASVWSKGAHATRRVPQEDPSLEPAPSTGRRDLGIFGPTEERCRGAALIG
jgi:hypothetical protein